MAGKSGGARTKKGEPKAAAERVLGKLRSKAWLCTELERRDACDGAKNCVDDDVRSESKGDASDRRAGGVSVWSVTRMDHSSQITMVRQIEISRVAHGTAKFNRFERIGIVKGDEFGNKIRALGLQPNMEKQALSALLQVPMRPTREWSMAASDPRLNSMCGSQRNPRFHR